jgi:hypothetical protein
VEKDAFFREVAGALSACQLVEQALKLYLAEALELVAERVGTDLPFKMRGEHYDDASLERLIDNFRKLSDDATLIADLRAFKDERNFLSHNSIAYCINPDGEFDDGIAQDLEARIKAIGPKAETLPASIHHAANDIHAKFWFEVLPGVG